MEDGRRVHVIERDLSEPDGIVGELLQPGGYLNLLELALELEEQHKNGTPVSSTSGGSTSFHHQHYNRIQTPKTLYNGGFDNDLLSRTIVNLSVLQSITTIQTILFTFFF